MAKKEFTYRGKKLEELQQMSLTDLAALLPAPARKRIKKGFTAQQQKLLQNLKKSQQAETHCREMIILPEMIGKMIKVYNGKEFLPVQVMPEMIGHRLGEFALTRKKVQHSAPGIGATRSSASISVK